MFFPLQGVTQALLRHTKIALVNEAFALSMESEQWRVEGTLLRVVSER
jgi:hypothetical protein